MGDLISRSSLIETLRNPTTFEELLEVTLEDFSNLINEQPTAYNVENVVAELEEHRANFDCRICKYNKTEGQVCLKDCTEALIDGLFDIVKRGGVDERT